MALKEILANRRLEVFSEFKEFQDFINHYRGRDTGGVQGDPRPLLESPYEFYLQSPGDQGFLQGDMLSGLTPIWSDREGAIETEEKFHAMVMSNECDTELRDRNSQHFIRLCPLYPESYLINRDVQESNNEREYRGALRANKYNEYFWMPGLEAIDVNGIVADIGHVFSIELKALHSMVADSEVQRVMSLSEDAYYIFKMKLAWFYLRPVSDSRRAELEPIDLERCVE